MCNRYRYTYSQFKQCYGLVVDRFGCIKHYDTKPCCIANHYYYVHTYSELGRKWLSANNAVCNGAVGKPYPKRGAYEQWSYMLNNIGNPVC